jgi:hypothetical protein
VNSPGRAGVSEQASLDELAQAITGRMALRLTTCSPVWKAGREEQRDPYVDRLPCDRETGRGGVRARFADKRCRNLALSARTRTTPMPPRPGGERTATMVSG